MTSEIRDVSFCAYRAGCEKTNEWHLSYRLTHDVDIGTIINFQNAEAIVSPHSILVDLFEFVVFSGIERLENKFAPGYLVFGHGLLL